MTANNHANFRVMNKMLPVITVALILTVLLVARTSSLIITGPTWDPSSAYTNNTINCSWSYSADTTAQNITILNNSVIFSNSYESGEPFSTWFAVTPEDTTKGEIWTCRITLFNSTDSITSERNLTILNTAPTTEGGSNGVFNNGQDIGYFFTILEDVMYVIDVNASDSDGDIVTYLAGDEFCTRTSSTLGTYNCNATQGYIVNNSATQINITFVVTDGQNPGGRTVSFNITPVNDAPSFSSPLSNKSVNESSYFNYTISGTDEEDNFPLNFSLSVDPFLDLRINLASNTSAVIIYGSPDPLPLDSANNYTVNVTIYDSLGANSTESFVLKVNETNAWPILSFIPNQTGQQGESLLFYVNATDTDENDNLSFSLTLSRSCAVSNPWSIITIDSSNNATGMINVTNLTNDHVICKYVNITVFDVGDAGARDSQDVFLNISNTNDPPNVEVLSSYSNNSGGNNISNLIAYAESAFIYLVNATDPDTLTDDGDSLVFSNEDTPLFTINSTTGLITFTPNQSQVGTYAINITVTDGEFNDTETLNINITPNSAPVLTPIGNLLCAEDSVCLIVINATDADSDDLDFTSSNTTVFNLTNNASQSPVSSAYVNYTPQQGLVGTYGISITVTDIRGAYDNETIFFTVNNTNDEPVLQSFNFPSIIAETHPVSFYVFANDQDYDLPSDYAYIYHNGIYLTEFVNFSVTNLSGMKLFNLTTYLNSSNNKTYTIVQFTPDLGYAGNYSVNISATDYSGANNWTVRSFAILPKAEPPNITKVSPYGRPVNSSTVFDFINTSLFNSSKITLINFSENRSVLYNVTVTDDITPTENLLYYWFINGTLNSTSSYLNVSYGFFSEGGRNITLVVENERYENTSWTWSASVLNINRAPLLMSPLRNLSLNGTTNDEDYLKETGSNTHFIDPDDEVINDGNHEFDDGESSSLTYNVTDCTVANIAINGHSIRVEPTEIGFCTVWFTAIDAGGLTNTSNPVTINVSAVSNSTTPIEVQRSSGGGGSSRSRSIVVPIKKEEETPRAIEIVVPSLVTIYENKTVLIPVTVKNTWNSSLKDVRLNATTNGSTISTKFTDDYFEELKVGESRDVTLMVDNYRLGNNYEIKITANVTIPYTSDSALVMLNTIEQADTGPDVETKVTFAQDLLRENPECIELNELLERAKTEISAGSKNEASRMVDAVINGCKYMVSISKKADQQPRSIVNKFFNKANLKYMLAFAGLAAVALATVFTVRKKKSSLAKKEIKEKTTEEENKEEVKPYWPG